MGRSGSNWTPALTVVVAPSSQSAGAARGLRDDWRWAYTDGNAAIDAALENRLSARNSRLSSPAAFQAEVVVCRADFTTWVDANLAGQPLEEYLRTPLEKNPFLSDLFLHLVWLRLLSHAARQDGTDLLIITDSLGMERSVAKMCGAAGVHYRCVGRAPLRIRTAGRQLLSVVRFARESILLLIRTLLARAILRSAYRRKLEGLTILIQAYVHDGDVSPDGSFRHRYLPGLVEWYQKNGLTVGIYPMFYNIPLHHFLHLYRAIGRCTIRILPFERFITLGDLWRSVRAVLPRARARPIQSFMGIDVSSLVAERRLSSAVGAVVPFALMAAPRRIRDAGLRPTLLVDWFENQPVNKATFIGFRKALASCRVVGLRQYIIYPNWLSMFTTTNEVDAGVVSAEHWVCGRGQEAVAATYDSRSTFKVVPALRYAYLYAEPPRRDRRTETDLAVLLTHSLDESRSILRALLEGGPPPAAADGRITVKLHPDLPDVTFRAECAKRWPQAPIHWSSASLAELLATARIVITGGTSSALEAICRGVPVIMVGQSANVDINPLETVDNRMWQTVYDAAGLRRVVRSWTPHPLDLAERIALGMKIRNDHFEPVNDLSMRAFLANVSASPDTRRLAFKEA